MGRCFLGDKEGKLFQAEGTISLHGQGLARGCSMGGSWGKESSDLAVKGQCVMPGDLGFAL